MIIIPVLNSDLDNLLIRCVEKETGNPIFGSTGSLSETVGSEQNCECARHYYESLVQGCKMSIQFHGNITLFQVK